VTWQQRLKQKLDSGNCTVSVVGLGYVGLAVATEFSRAMPVVGFDIDEARLAKLNGVLAGADITLTANARDVGRGDFIIICVPTPVTRTKEPDLGPVRGAAEAVARVLSPGKVVVLESTVYPGVTEEVVLPILEGSGLRCGADFGLGYSPERVNPGDEAHTLRTITKVVSGRDAETARLVADLYGKVCPHVFLAPDVRTAEAAKVIENIQRDLNIALMNELSLIFERMGLSTRQVLEAARTKWNFQPYAPGLVGGHCIPVDPYYLVHKAKELGYHSQVILAGRAINDHMPRHVATLALKALNEAGKVPRQSRLLIMGLTYKENVPDVREAPAHELIAELREYGVDLYGLDPLLEADVIRRVFDVAPVASVGEVPVDGAIMTVAHGAFRGMSLEQLKASMRPHPVMVDVRGVFDPGAARSTGFIYRSLL